MMMLDEFGHKDIMNIEHRPLVSVIVPTYRRDTHLKKALLSLVEQTYSPIEIIVVDDNAEGAWNKKVEGVVRSFDTNIRVPIVYIQNDTNSGSAETRNVGIRAAAGEYITFLDDDDLYLPKKIEKQISHMVDEGSDFSITDLDLFDENNRLVERRVRSYLKTNNREQLFKYHFLYHITGTDTMMFKKSYLQKIGCFPPIDMGDEFYLMQIAIENGGKFSYWPGCQVKAYVHYDSNGISSGETKIIGENVLYEYKKKFFNQLDRKTIRYIKMRHYAVLAFAELRRRHTISFIRNTTYSFFSSPTSAIRLLNEIRMNRDRS